MSLLLLSFVAGVLTILAPCVLPILPVIVGGSVINGKRSRPWVIILSFAVSVVLFTLLIKFAADTIGLHPDQLREIAAWILILFGLFLLFPKLRQRLMHISGAESATNSAQAQTGTGVKGDILLGFVLGPVFNSCSPTYAVLVATILPVNFWRGLTNILAYVLGMVVLLGLIAWGGKKIIARLRWAADPKGWFKKAVAVLLIFVGIAMLFSRDKQAEAWLLQNDLGIDMTLWEGRQLREFK